MFAMEVMTIDDIVEWDWYFGENVEICWMGFPKFTGYIKSIDEDRFSTYNLISEAMKYLVSRWMLEVSICF